MTNVGDLSQYAGFTFGQNYLFGDSTTNSRRIRNTRIPANSTVSQRGIARFQKRVDTVIQKEAEKDVNKKYTYVEFDDRSPLDSSKTHANLFRGDNTRDQFIGIGVRPLYLKIQYQLQWLSSADADPLKVARILVIQWLNQEGDEAISKVLLNNTTTDPTIQPWVLAYKNPAEMDNFLVQADHVKVMKPIRGNPNGDANIPTYVFAVGEIYVSKKQMENILLKPEVEEDVPLVPIRGQQVIYWAGNSTTADTNMRISYISELCYTDKM